MKKQILLALASCSLAFAGMSIEGGAAQVICSSVPNTPNNRVEIFLDSWTLPGGFGTGHVLGGGASGWEVNLLFNGALQILNTWDTQTVGYIGPDLTNVSPHGIYLRLQHDMTAMTATIEIWDTTNTRIFFQVVPFTASTPSGTTEQTSFGGEVNRTYGFIRMHNTLVAPNSRQPVTVDNAGRVFEWKFDGGGASPTVGTLNDASGNGHNATIGFGSAVYSPTNYQNVIGVLATAGHPVWGNVVSQRAGQGLYLDGTSSFSQDDNTSAVSYFWQQLGGPSQLFWDSHNTGTPRATGNITGDYPIQLTVIDFSNAMSTVSDHVGSVATDENSVVVQKDPLTDALFGPMIAFGKNPWGYADYWHQHAQVIRAGTDGLHGDYKNSIALPWTTGTLNKPEWEYASGGTVDYWWNGVGRVAGNNTTPPYTGTTLSASATSTDLVLHVVDATKLDLTSLPTIPTRIQIAPNFGSSTTEEVRICSVSGNDLTVCYDGRGQLCNPGCGVTGSWSSGATVGQFKLIGHSTAFLTDARSICPLGAGGKPGPSFYSTGTVSLTPGSATLTGSGTGWVDPFNNLYVGKFLQINATHSGTPFVFIAQITSVNSTTSITLQRPYPSDADSISGASYNIVSASRTVVLHYTRFTDPSSNTDGMAMWGTMGCESETTAYLNSLLPGNSFAGGHDTPLDGTLLTGRAWSVTDHSGYINGGATGGISFYGEGGASRALCLSSGLAGACTAADLIDDYWPRSPWGNIEVFGGTYLTKSQAVFSVFRTIMTSGASVPWGTARSYFAAGEAVANYMNTQATPADGCASYDSRDSGYALTWLILGAIYDPDTTTVTKLPDGTPITGFKNRWVSDLAIMKNVDDNCHLVDNSWATSAGRWGAGGPSLSMTNGSKTVTSLGTISSAQCSGITTGTGTVTNGSGTLTITSGTIGAGNAGTTGVVVDRTDHSSSQSYLYSGSGSTVTMSALWPGTSGTVEWMQFDATNPMFSFGNAGADDSLKKNYQCILNSPTSLTLDRGWEGLTGNYFGFPVAWPIQGFGQQPYMLGIKSLGMNFLGNSSISPYNSTYSPTSGYTNDAVTWIKNNGFDPNNLGMAYGRVFQWCEPFSTITNNTFSYRTPNCSYGSGVNAAVQARALNAETSNATGILYKASPTGPNKTYGDQLYGAMWGNPAYNTGGVYTDSLTLANNVGASNLNDANISAGKWYGFFSGMGLLRNWPAVRLGGVKPVENRSIAVSFDLASVSNSTKVSVVVTSPNGNVASPVVCTVSPCQITIDGRMGPPLVAVSYLSSSNITLAGGLPIPIQDIQ